MRDKKKTINYRSARAAADNIGRGPDIKVNYCKIAFRLK